MAKIWDIEVLRSDVIRKTLFQNEDGRTSREIFGKGMYSRDATAATYDKMLSMALERLEQAESVILDATFSNAAWRSAAIDLARRKEAIAVLVECRACEAILAARLRERETRPTISDARIHHLKDFKKHFEPYDMTEGGIHMVIDTESPLELSLQQVMLTYVLRGDIRDASPADE